MSEGPDEIPDEISCDNCVAACCRAPVAMTLTQKEYDRHSPKMDLELIKAPLEVSRPLHLSHGLEDAVVPAGFGLFVLKSGCANLSEDNRCSIYKDRPTCCRAFEMGSPDCLKARRKVGLDADRPATDEDALPQSSDVLVQHFFPALLEPEEPTAPRSNAAPQLGPLDLQQRVMSVSRDSRWIGERLSTSDAAVWSRRTRCPDWSVGALAAHVVTGLRQADAVLRGAIMRRAAELPDEFKGDRVSTLRAYGAAVDAVNVSLEHITVPTLMCEVAFDDGSSVIVQDLIDVLVMELAVHALDLADALGEPRHLSPEAVSAVARALPNFLDPGTAPPKGTAYVLRSPAFEMPFAWHQNAWTRRAGTDPCSIDGDSESVLLYALGRVPFDKSGLTTNQPDLARRFKRHLVGP